MKKNLVKVLAVADPAVYVYVKEDYKLIQGFEYRYGIKVQFDIIPWKKYYDTLLKALEGGLDYDVVMVAGHLWLKDFVNKGYLHEIQKHNYHYDYEDIIKAVRDEMELEGKKYLFPSFCDGHIVVYRKSILKKAFGEIDKKVINTDEYIKMASACHGYDGMAGVAMKAHESEIFLDFLPYIRNEGIEPIDEETHLPKLDQNQCLIALNKYINLRKYAIEGTEGFGNDEVREAFQNKRVAMTITWGGQLGMVMNDKCLEPEDVGFLALSTGWNVTWSFGITSQSHRKEEAETLLRYLTSKEADRYVGGFAGSPVRMSTYKTDGHKYPWYDIHYELITKYAKPIPKMLNTGMLIGPIYSSVYEAFTGKISPKESLIKAQMAIMDMIVGGV